jgi:large subunit ribosomal protein L3
MNKSIGLIGRKLGMTQFHSEDGTLNRVTAIEAGPCVVVSKRTLERDGYSALQLGFGEFPERLVSMPVRGQFKKADCEPKRVLREFRVTDAVAAEYEVGDEITVDKVFTEGDIVDVTGVSKGRGYSGVVRRHHFAGSVSSHGSHEYFRHGGSIGQNMTPGRVFKGVKMPGQHGNKRVTTQNMRIVRVDPEAHVVFIRGSVPGSKRAVVTVRGAVKKKGAQAS